MQRFQNKLLSSTANAPRYEPNTILHIDLQIPTAKAEITNFSTKYREKLITRPNELIPALIADEEAKKIKNFQTNWTNKILISTVHRYKNIWCEDIQWNITPQVMQYNRQMVQ